MKTELVKSLKITILTDNSNSWILPYVEKLKFKLYHHKITHIFNHKDINSGDIMLILSCEKIISSDHLNFHKHNIVVHPSRLPHGKGWSPLAWQVFEGKNTIPVSLFEATEELDSGDVYLVEDLHLDGCELNNKIKHKQGIITIKMIQNFIDNYESIVGIPQTGKGSVYRKRITKDSELDINKSIKEQINLLRIVDHKRYPAHFYVGNKKYVLKIYEED